MRWLEFMRRSKLSRAISLCRNSVRGEDVSSEEIKVNHTFSSLLKIFRGDEMALTSVQRNGFNSPHVRVASPATTCMISCI